MGHGKNRKTNKQKAKTHDHYIIIIIAVVIIIMIIIVVLPTCHSQTMPLSNYATLKLSHSQTAE